MAVFKRNIEGLELWLTFAAYVQRAVGVTTYSVYFSIRFTDSREFILADSYTILTAAAAFLHFIDDFTSINQ